MQPLPYSFAEGLQQWDRSRAERAGQWDLSAVPAHVAELRPRALFSLEGIVDFLRSIVGSCQTTSVVAQMSLSGKMWNVGVPPNACIGAVTGFGFTERQARFLATVMLHSGVFVDRQYAAFAGITHGQKVHEFIEKLLMRRFVTPIELGSTGRTRIFHVHHKPLYAATGEPDNRNRRRVTGLRVTQPRVSDLLRGRIDLFSTDTLIDMLASLGVGVRLVVKSTRSRRVA